jgi:hypothetical protein
MAEKVSVKLIVFFSFLCGFLSACIEPVDITTFYKDNDVQQIVVAVNKAVKVDYKNGDGLKGIKEKITGLKNDKYYMVEKETDEKGAPVIPTDSPYPKYVTDYQNIGPGGLDPRLGLITRINDGNINNLTDLHTYTVRSAEPFANGNLSYTDQGGASEKQITDGVINIDKITGTTGSLNLSTVITGSYEVIGVSVGTSQNSWFWKSKIISDWSSFPLEGPDTEVDYVFVKENTPSDFKVLKVKIGAAVKTIDIAAVSGVTVPATGTKPVTTITETEQYTGTVTWDNGNPSTFADSIAYTATITLTPKTGYTLQGVNANFFTVSGATASNAANTGVITAVFPPTVATVINIAAIPGVTPPLTGATPVTVITETPQYTGTVAWNGDPVTFAPGTAYTATITLAPKPGYTLQGVTKDFFTVTGANPVTNNANSGVVTAVFPATALIVVNIAAIQGVTPPKTDSTPVTAITANDQYSGTVEWSPAVSGTFADSQIYTATITLTAKTGYTLQGVTNNFFTVAGADTVTNNANTGVITAIFPVTVKQGISINIVFTVAGMNIDSPNNTISIGATGQSPVTLTLSVKIGGITSSIIPGDIKWYYNGNNTPIQTGETTLVLNNASGKPYLIVGSHVFTVEGTINGAPYSDSFTINVVE